MPVSPKTGEVEAWNHWGMCDECKLFARPAPVRHLRGGKHYMVPYLTVPRWLNPVYSNGKSWNQCNWCYARRNFGHEPNGSFVLAI
jgi:hypothetical protein